MEVLVTNYFNIVLQIILKEKIKCSYQQLLVQIINDKYSRKEIFSPEFYGFRKASSFNLRLYEYSDRYLRDNKGSFYSYYEDENYKNKVHGYLNAFVGIWQDKAYLDEILKVS